MFLFDFIFPLPLYLYTEFNSWTHLWDLQETEKEQCGLLTKHGLVTSGYGYDHPPAFHWGHPQPRT